MASFDAVLFDLDGTLCQNTQDAHAMYEQAFERVDETPFGEPSSLWSALSGPPDHDDPVGYFAAGFARVAAQHGRTDVDALALARALRSVIDDRAVGFLPGAEEALAEAAAVGPIGVVTNGPEDRQRAKLDALGIADRFATVVYAAELSRSKPHTEPFEQAVAKLGVARDRTLYVGDSLAYDVAGAQNAGLPVAWLRGDEEQGDYEPEYVLDSLAELPAILRGEA
ncbi:HAD family hydrolase [Halonotius terrestris]|uniref:HAD family hydrolase n=1 Tax=Halonotius terrestris TaxID=2487750 RepID=A0A8J8TD89_9EURY|nr:HAD family hydrolase [Halonotius terrestris]TQQ83276.1 HAD family hydrolase [Halonotius terrestris]